MAKNILIVEDDAVFGTMLEKWFRRNEYATTLTTSVKVAKESIIKNKTDLVVADLRLPDGDGITLLQWIREQKFPLPVIIMTGYGEVQSAVSAIKLGAEDYLEKPINPTILKEKIESALNKQSVTAPIAQKRVSVSQLNNVITGTSQASKVMYDYLTKVAPTTFSVMLLGESGTGKEYAARTIHENSVRSSKPFIAVDCGSLSKDLAPSEFFGHVKGAFTSAINDKVGVFEQANGGTLFLDEVGNLSYEVQIQLLRALQERKVRPVGSVKDIPVDVRIITATNENLEQAIADGFFREDLFHRLNEVSIRIPPLRERRDDIPLFAEEFLRQANEDLNRHIEGYTPEALTILTQQHWNGNLRELRNVVRRTALFASDKMITAADLPPFTTVAPTEEDLALRPTNERAQIEAALHKARGNKSVAAQLLKIDRKTLYNKMHQLGIDL